jgi:hypothetical protein
MVVVQIRPDENDDLKWVVFKCKASSPRPSPPEEEREKTRPASSLAPTLKRALFSLALLAVPFRIAATH